MLADLKNHRLVTYRVVFGGAFHHRVPFFFFTEKTPKDSVCSLSGVIGPGYCCYWTGSNFLG